jgi:hypothetical protein
LDWDQNGTDSQRSEHAYNDASEKRGNRLAEANVAVPAIESEAPSEAPRDGEMDQERSLHRQSHRKQLVRDRPQPLDCDRHRNPPPSILDSHTVQGKQQQTEEQEAQDLRAKEEVALRTH